MANFEPDDITDAELMHKTTREYKLYINNVPRELNQDGLKELFENYGKVIGVLYPRNSTWAFVTYSTYQEAEYAIKELNDTSPLYLRIQFAKNERKQTIPENMLKSHDARYSNKIFPRTIGRGRPLATDTKDSSLLPVSHYTAEDDLLYPVPIDTHTYNPYEPPERYLHSNTLWTRGVTTITEDGKRHVSLGRGYTHYEIPDAPTKLDNALKKVHALRNGSYGSGEWKLGSNIGQCKSCLMIAKLRCQRCQEFYCSRECQIADWPMHKTECLELPGLVEAMDSTSISKTNTKQEGRLLTEPITPETLRRPKVTTQTPPSIPSNPYPTLRNTDTNCQRFDKNSNSYKVQTNSFNKQDEKASTQQSDRRSDQRQDTANKHNNFSNSDKQTRPQAAHVPASNEDILNKCNEVEEGITFKKDVFLPKTTFTEVQISVKCSQNEFWVQKLKDINPLGVMEVSLQQETSKASVIAPKIGNMCAALFENLWYRAIVTSLKPLKVRFIDYGNTEIVKEEHIRAMNVFQNVQPYARKIRLSPDAIKRNNNLNIGDRLLVKALSVDSENTIIVQLQGESDKNINEDNGPAQRAQSNDSSAVQNKQKPTAVINDKRETPHAIKSVVSSLTDKQIGVMQINTALSNTSYSVTLLPEELHADFQILLDDLPDSCRKLMPNLNGEFRPSVGDLICGHRMPDDDWVRGYVLSTEPSMRIAVIDEARTAIVKEILPCPQKFSNIRAFGAMLELPSSNKKLQDMALPFEVVSRTKDSNNEDTAEIELLDNDRKKIGTKGIIKMWKPLPEQKGVRYAELKSGIEVCLTSYRNQNHLYARSLEHKEIERYSKIMQRVAKAAKTAANLKEPPVVGQIVLAQYLDTNYYRAIVVKIEGEKVGISYIDFGNAEFTEWKKLKELPDDLKEMRSCTAKITMKDVPINTPMTKEANELLESLVALETPLLCTYVGDSLKEGVYLKTPNGESVNNKLKNLLTPSHEKNLNEEEDLTCFMVNDLETVSLGDVGSTVSAIVLCKMPDSDQYVMCPFDQELITHVMEILPALINKHCKATQHYIPRENELCLALYENNWYRAVCLCRNQTPDTATVFFVDYGNVENVAHTNIRKMVQEFMTPCALVSICTIVNSSGKAEFTSTEREKISSLLIPNQTIKVKIIKAMGGGCYDVELTDIDINST